MSSDSEAGKLSLRERFRVMVWSYRHMAHAYGVITSRRGVYCPTCGSRAPLPL